MNAPALNIAGDGDDAFRATHVGASEVAALFDCSRWVTHFELWHRKAGNVSTPDFNTVDENGVPENERIFWGVALEPAIIEAAKLRYGYVDREQVKHLSNGKGLGAHPDRRVTCPERGPGVIEVKMVDWLERKRWGDEPPLDYLLQNMTSQGLDGVTWGDVVVLVGGNKLERFSYDFRPKLFAEIEARVAAFWQSVRDGKPPKPDYTRDGDTISSLIGEPTDEVIDLRRHNRAGILACEFLDAKAREKAAEKEAETAKAELLEIVGDAGAALLDGYRIGCAMTKGSAGTLITQDHVGTHVGGRRGWRQFNVKEVIA